MMLPFLLAGAYQRALNRHVDNYHGNIMLNLMLERAEGPMEVFVETATNKTLTLNVYGVDAVDSVKDKIYDAEGVPPDHQLLTFSGRQMEGHQTLMSYGVMSRSTLCLEQVQGAPCVTTVSFWSF